MVGKYQGALHIYNVITDTKARNCPSILLVSPLILKQFLRIPV